MPAIQVRTGSRVPIQDPIMEDHRIFISVSLPKGSGTSSHSIILKKGRPFSPWISFSFLPHDSSLCHASTVCNGTFLFLHIFISLRANYFADDLPLLFLLFWRKIHFIALENCVFRKSAPGSRRCPSIPVREGYAGNQIAERRFFTASCAGSIKEFPWREMKSGLRS